MRKLVACVKGKVQSDQGLQKKSLKVPQLICDARECPPAMPTVSWAAADVSQTIVWHVLRLTAGSRAVELRNKSMGLLRLFF